MIAIKNSINSASIISQIPHVKIFDIDEHTLVITKQPTQFTQVHVKRKYHQTQHLLYTHNTNGCMYIHVCRES